MVFQVGVDVIVFFVLKKAAIYKVTKVPWTKKKNLTWELLIVEISQEILEFEGNFGRGVDMFQNPLATNKPHPLTLAINH